MLYVPWKRFSTSWYINQQWCIGLPYLSLFVRIVSLLGGTSEAKPAWLFYLYVMLVQCTVTALFSFDETQFHILMHGILISLNPFGISLGKLGTNAQCIENHMVGSRVWLIAIHPSVSWYIGPYLRYTCMAYCKCIRRELHVLYSTSLCYHISSLSGSFMVQHLDTIVDQILLFVPINIHTYSINLLSTHKVL